jgi:hypothetical protein
MVRAVHLHVVQDFCTHHNLPGPYATDADSERDVPEFMSTSGCPLAKDRLLSENTETEKELLVQLTNCAVDHIILHLHCLPHHGVCLPHHCNNVFQEDNLLSKNVMTGNALLASFTNMSLSN